ncbi:BURP domain-containing protein 3-like isoform X1 [Musa acuminata AAA Group]|uniref:BURP domain-containing protein 3-like isoform X1 n=2 Tax=Musa acuminata AAA Group TaxID=214697 RepID=UPI0031D1A738
MDRFRSLLTLFLLAVVGHAALPPRLVDWNSVVPNTPMPSAISDLKNPDVTDEQKSGTNVSVGMGGVNVSSKGDSGGATVKVGEGGVHVGTWKPGGGTTFDVGEEGVNVNTSHEGGGRPVVVRVPFSSGLSFSYAAAERQIHDDPSVALFYLEKGFKSGSKSSVQFKKTTTGAAFHPRKEAESIPFSSAKLPEILNYYGVNPGSAEALVMEKTVQECENLAARWGGAVLRHLARVHGGVQHVEPGDTRRHGGVDRRRQGGLDAAVVHDHRRKPRPGYRPVACHPVAYKYAVFYCHTTATSKASRVGLVGADSAVGGGCGGVPHRHQGVEPQPRRLQGARGEARLGAGVPLPAGEPRRVEPQHLK